MAKRIKTKEKNENWSIEQSVHSNNYGGKYIVINIEYVSGKFLTKKIQNDIIKLLNFKPRPNGKKS